MRERNLTLGKKMVNLMFTRKINFPTLVYWSQETRRSYHCDATDSSHYRTIVATNLLTHLSNTVCSRENVKMRIKYFQPRYGSNTSFFFYLIWLLIKINRHRLSKSAVETLAFIWNRIPITDTSVKYATISKIYTCQTISFASFYGYIIF